MKERERKREQEMPIFVLSSKCKYRIQGVRQPLKRYPIINVLYEISDVRQASLAC